MEALTVTPGKWITRNNRLVVITHSFEASDPPMPGMPPVKRQVWEGTLYQANGTTPDSKHAWEGDGRFKTPRGVATEFDLRSAVAA